MEFSPLSRRRGVRDDASDFARVVKVGVKRNFFV